MALMHVKLNKDVKMYKAFMCLRDLTAFCLFLFFSPELPATYKDNDFFLPSILNYLWSLSDLHYLLAMLTHPFWEKKNLESVFGLWREDLENVNLWKRCSIDGLLRFGM